MTKQHGGARDGAGRKPGMKRKKVMITIPLDLIDKLDQVGNKSATVEAALYKYFNEQAIPPKPTS